VKTKINAINFRIALTSSGLTQQQFARRHDVSQPLISMILAGQRQPSKKLGNIMSGFIGAQFDRLKIVQHIDINKAA
jgi:transcriptional regulator with XRE-family HTH domain